MIILDTHVWLWWLHDPKKLSRRASSAIRKAEADAAIRVSAISVWEVAVKHKLGKLALPPEFDIHRWYETASAYPAITIEPLDPIDAISSTVLPGEFHQDPADRIIVAMARRHDVPLVTVDQKILDYEHVQTIS